MRLRQRSGGTTCARLVGNACRAQSPVPRRRYLGLGVAQQCGAGTAFLSTGQPDPTWHLIGNLAADSLFVATNPTHLTARCHLSRHQGGPRHSSWWA
jgi:hypothetical protein